MGLEGGDVTAGIFEIFEFEWIMGIILLTKANG